MSPAPGVSAYFDWLFDMDAVAGSTTPAGRVAESTTSPTTPPSTTAWSAWRCSTGGADWVVLSVCDPAQAEATPAMTTAVVLGMLVSLFPEPREQAGAIAVF
ncbi:hypothetical protein ACWEWQ_26410, partial [Streptomyces sp. NPDC003832]